MRACRWRVGMVVPGFGLLAGAAPAHAVGVEAIAHCGADAACLAQLEAAALRESAGTVQRDGSALPLQVGLQPPARFVDQGPLVHRYLGKLDGVLLHLVRAWAPNQLPAWWLVGESGQAPLKIDAL